MYTLALRRTGHEYKFYAQEQDVYIDIYICIFFITYVYIQVKYNTYNIL